MKRGIIIIIVLVIVVIAAKLTVPEKDKHYHVAQQKLVSIVGNKMSSVDGLKEMAQGENMDVNALIKAAVGQMEVHDYFVCNVGIISYDGAAYPLTIGIFNHVFVLTDYLDEVQNAGKKAEKYKKKLK